MKGLLSSPLALRSAIALSKVVRIENCSSRVPDTVSFGRMLGIFTPLTSVVGSALLPQLLRVVEMIAPQRRRDKQCLRVDIMVMMYVETAEVVLRGGKLAKKIRTAQNYMCCPDRKIRY